MSDPTDFEVYVGTFAGASYGVWWDGEQLIYESFGRGYQRPTTDSHFAVSGPVGPVLEDDGTNRRLGMESALRARRAI